MNTFLKMGLICQLFSLLSFAETADHAGIQYGRISMGNSNPLKSLFTNEVNKLVKTKSAHIIGKPVVERMQFAIEQVKTQGNYDDYVKYLEAVLIDKSLSASLTLVNYLVQIPGSPPKRDILEFSNQLRKLSNKDMEVTASGYSKAIQTFNVLIQHSDPKYFRQGKNGATGLPPALEVARIFLSPRYAPQ